ncbi:hypothetical protein ACNR9Q_10855 [Maribacter sp. X9]|uniref:hypothetical protein n=1 Tax=Maribacter sp. X9 TaxID=3402159 RepID=UPI003AF3E52F
MKTKTIIFALLFSMIFSISMVAQSSKKEPEFYNWFDDQVERYNTGLFNGIEYIELFRTINERHKFFKSNEFQTGSIVYDGQFYDQVPLKYDLHTDELLFNVGYNYPYPTLILFKNKVKSFSLGDSDFSRIDISKGEQPMNGFYEELLMKEPITLLKKNKKKRFKRIKGNTIYYEFDYENNYILNYDDTFYEIKSKKDVLNIWPNKKEFINENFNPALRKSNEDNFWINFFTKLADTFTNKNEGEKL